MIAHTGDTRSQRPWYTLSSSSRRPDHPRLDDLTILIETTWPSSSKRPDYPCPWSTISARFRGIHGWTKPGVLFDASFERGWISLCSAPSDVHWLLLFLVIILKEGRQQCK